MNQSDHTHLFAAQKGMQDAISTMEKLAPALGMAKQIVEFASDRRRSALSVNVVPHLKAGESAAAAEHLARASDEYKAEMTKILNETAAAEKTIAQWTLSKIKFECARSLLSTEKSLLAL
jgi:endonuclease IV